MAAAAATSPSSVVWSARQISGSKPASQLTQPKQQALQAAATQQQLGDGGSGIQASLHEYSKSTIGRRLEPGSRAAAAAVAFFRQCPDRASAPSNATHTARSRLQDAHEHAQRAGEQRLGRQQQLAGQEEGPEDGSQRCAAQGASPLPELLLFGRGRESHPRMLIPRPGCRGRHGGQPRNAAGGPERAWGGQTGGTFDWAAAAIHAVCAVKVCWKLASAHCDVTNTYIADGSPTVRAWCAGLWMQLPLDIG